MDHKFKKKFRMELNIAENHGIDAVKETLKRVFREWKTNHTFLYELTLVMNCKCCDHDDQNNIELSKLYTKYYNQLCEYAMKNLNGEELYYFVKNPLNRYY